MPAHTPNREIARAEAVGELTSLMSAQALAALVTVGLVVARAVNVLK